VKVDKSEGVSTCQQPLFIVTTLYTKNNGNERIYPQPVQEKNDKFIDNDRPDGYNY
jgi:hypothetical protein